jgi:uncharacterized membrane protein YphA (DoxX/SURF4 family)
MRGLYRRIRSKHCHFVRGRLCYHCCIHFLSFSMFPSLKQQSDWVILIVRLILAGAFIYHGYQKWPLWSGVPEGMPQWLGVTFQILSVLEPLAGLALLVGFMAEWAALVTGLIMVGAISFKVFMLQVPYAASNGTGWEFDLALFGLSLVMMMHGAGSMALDASMMPKKKK